MTRTKSSGHRSLDRVPALRMVSEKGLILYMFCVVSLYDEERVYSVSVVTVPIVGGRQVYPIFFHVSR
jgi:hypothetical protein